MRRDKTRAAILAAAFIFVLGSAILPFRTGAVRAAVPTFAGLGSELGMPSAPQLFTRSAPGQSYAVTLEYRDPLQDGGAPTAMSADHGADCSAPPATHTTGLSFEDGVFICHDHLMTATSSNDSGYSNIYVEPPAMLDWSQSGTATLALSMSTFRTAARDWVDFWFMPFANQSPNPETVGVDGQGPPLNGLHIEMIADDLSQFHGEYYVSGIEHDFAGTGLNLHQVLTPSKTVRSPFVFTVSSSHVTFGIPSLKATFVDAPIALNFTQGVFQFGHHSYTPYKEDPGAPPEQLALGLQAAPDTWHWSDLVMSPAVPITIINPTEASAPDHECSSCVLRFPTPAPSGAFIRYRAVAFNSSVALSFNGGATWVPGVNVVGEQQAYTHMEDYYQPVPAGTTSVMVRGEVRDAIITSQSSSTVLPTVTPSPTATPVPPTATATATATPTQPPVTPTPTPTPILLNNTVCMITEGGVMVNGICNGTFTPSP